MNPHDFLDLAGELAAGIRESDWRTATGRAYYATFHVARALFRRCGFDVPQAERSHSYLAFRLSNSGHPNVERAGRTFARLRHSRNQADYDLSLPILHHDAHDRVMAAMDIIKILEDLAAMPTLLAQVVDAIKTYERDVLREVTWRP